MMSMNLSISQYIYLLWLYPYLFFSLAVWRETSRSQQGYYFFFFPLCIQSVGAHRKPSYAVSMALWSSQSPSPCLALYFHSALSPCCPLLRGRSKALLYFSLETQACTYLLFGDYYQCSVIHLNRCQSLHS